MRALLGVTLLCIHMSFPSACFAKDRYVNLIALPQESTMEEEKILSEIQVLLARLKKTRRSDQKATLVLWNRWTHAVCIGCDRTPKELRMVHTYPSRVLAGVVSATDDDRERRGLRI